MKKKHSFLISLVFISIFIFSGCAGNKGQEFYIRNDTPTPTPLFIHFLEETAAPEIKTKEENNLSEIETQVISITENVRGLKTVQPLSPVYISENELRDFLSKKISNTPDSSFEIDKKLYATLGYIPEDFDLKNFYVDLYSRSINGFYETDTDTMYLLENASAAENAKTLAHEYTHYLQYHTESFLPRLMATGKNCEDNAEMCTVVDAIVEGDAVLTETLSNASILISQNKETVKNTSSIAVQEIWIPDFFMDTSMFPYNYGYKFVFYMYSIGGYEKVNSLYQTPPESVEQLMHPAKYLSDKPVVVDISYYENLLKQNGYRIIQKNTFNEADVLMLLTDAYKSEWQISKFQALTAAEGWGGGSFLLADNGISNVIFIGKLTFDTLEDAEEAKNAFADYSVKRFGKEIGNLTWGNSQGLAARLECNNKDITYIIAPADLF